ncbi:MAG: MFS transporter [Anaerolineae bacterium]
MDECRGRPRGHGLPHTIRLLGARFQARVWLLSFQLALLWRRTWSAAEESLLGPRHAANERNLYLETLWFGVLSGITATFLEVFAVRLGATPFQVGLLSSLPALVNVLVPVPAARLLERQTGRIPLILQSVVWQRLAYFLLALVPFLGPRLQIGTLVLLAGLATIPAAVLNLGITVLIGDMASPRDRALVVSRRYVILAGTTTLISLLGGWWLDLVVFPLNYQILFGAGALASLLSIRSLRRINLPYSPPPAMEPHRSPRHVDLRRAWKRLASQRGFLRFCGSAFFYHWGLYLPSPLYAIYRVRNLGANDRWIGLIVMVHTATSILGYLMAGRYARRWGDTRLLLISSAGLALFPILTGLSTSLPPLLFIAVIGGIFGSGLSLALFNVSLALAPEGQRATYVALYTMLVNVAAFLAPLVGSALAETAGIRETFYLSGALRLLGVGAFLLAFSGGRGEETG